MKIFKNRSSGWWELRDILANLEEFENTTGNFRGRIHALGTGALPDQWAKAFKAVDAEYVIYSYRTLIAWKLQAGWIIPDVKYSVTTSRHQSKVTTAISQL